MNIPINDNLIVEGIEAWLYYQTKATLRSILKYPMTTKGRGMCIHSVLHRSSDLVQETPCHKYARRSDLRNWVLILHPNGSNFNLVFALVVQFPWWWLDLCHHFDWVCRIIKCRFPRPVEICAEVIAGSVSPWQIANVTFSTNDGNAQCKLFSV